MVEYKEIIRKSKELKRIVLEYENYVEIINLEETRMKQKKDKEDAFENEDFEEYEEYEECEEYNEEDEGYYDEEGTFIKWESLNY